MKHCRTLLAVILAGVAFSASAREHHVIVRVEQACPSGLVSKGPSYRFENGRFVREGWVCEDLQGRN